MTGESADPFALFDQLTAARTAEERLGIDVDRTRLKHDAERRDRLGQLRAREHPGSRPNGMVHTYFA